MPAAPAPLTTSLMSAMSRPVRCSALMQAGGGDDRRAVLVVMEDRDVHQLAQPLLDDEAVGRLDVLQVDAAEARARDSAPQLMNGVDILGVDHEIDGIDIGEALEQHRLAFHHRLGGQRAEIAEAENGGAVGDHGDQVALGGVVVGEAGILGDGQHRHGDARRIGQRQVALGGQRLGRRDLELARLALVEASASCSVTASADWHADVCARRRSSRRFGACAFRMSVRSELMALLGCFLRESVPSSNNVTGMPGDKAAAAR